MTVGAGQAVTIVTDEAVASGRRKAVASRYRETVAETVTGEGDLAGGGDGPDRQAGRGDGGDYKCTDLDRTAS